MNCIIKNCSDFQSLSDRVLTRGHPLPWGCMWSTLTRTVRRPGSTPGQGRSYPADVVPLQNWTCYWSKLYAGWETACCGGTTHSISWLNRTWRPIVWKKFLSFLHSAGEDIGNKSFFIGVSAFTLLPRHCVGRSKIYQTIWIQAEV